MTPEHQLILLLARGSLTSSDEQQALAMLATPLQWDALLERVTAEEVYPLVYRNLRTFNFAGVPEHVRSQLEALYKINAFRNTHLAEELQRILRLLENAGIPTMPLKGVALSEALYGDTAFRVCADIDILVPRQQVAQAFAELLAAGYQYGETYTVEAQEFDLLLESNIEYGFVRHRQGIRHLVELHWDIAWRWQGGRASLEDLWTEATAQAFAGASAYRLSPEWELLFLSVHATRHRWQSLKWLVDIHEVCSRKAINWELLATKADTFGWERILKLTLSVVHSLFATPIPARFLLTPLPSWLTLFPAASPTSNIWWDGAFPLVLLTRPAERLRYLLRISFLPTLADHRDMPLPSVFTFLYYPLRPLRLLCKWSWQFVSSWGRK